MFLGLPASRGRLRVSGTLLGALWMTAPAAAQATDPQDQLALRDVVRAAYIRAGQIKTDAEIDALSVSARPLVTFDPRAATEADIVGLVGRLGLTDASVPKPPAPVSLTRTLSTDPLPDYGGVDLTGRTAVDLAGMLQRGETTSREIVLQYMYKIQQLDHAGPALRSVEQINPDILTLADQADAQRLEAQREGRTLPPLFGVPVLLKMNIGTADDLRTTAGSAALIGSRPATEATLVTGMREQGLLIMGRANMGQWAGLSSNNRSDTGGQTISPVDPSIAVAGSSSGPSIAAAMRFAPLTVGSQTSDSIIYPAQQQGLYALKPTAGLISTTGIAPYSQQIDTAGPMGNSVHDLALALNGMVKLDTIDTRSKDFVRPADYNAGLTGDLTGLKVGIYSATPTEDPQRPAQFNSVVGGMLTAANAAVVSLDRAGVDAAVKTAVLAMSDDDFAQFVKFVDASVAIPADPAGRAAFLNDIRQNFTDGARWVEAATNGAVQFYFYDAYVSISGYLAARVSSPDDYKSAFVRLLGDKFSRLNVDPKVYARTIDDLVAFAQKNPGLSGDAALAGLAAQKIGPSYATIDEFNRAYANWIRISTALMSNVRNALGVDAVIGFLGTDDDTNDGLGIFTFSTEQTSTSPQLNVPFQVDGTPANILIDANPYQEQTLLRIGQALQQQLNSDAFRQYQAVAPNPPATGYGDDQPDDNGPLLPLVLKNLDDHGRATRAHLLTTEMAPLVLDVGGATMVPHFDGRISGNGGLIKDGTGIQLLTGTSDFTGGVFVWQGGLAVDKTEALGDSSNTVTLENKSALIATRSFALGRPVILNDGGTLGALAGATLTEDAVVSGNGGLSKTGQGRLILQADNTYTGGTQILAGTVSVSREANLGQAYGAVTIGDGAALEATASFTSTRPFTLEGASGLAVDPAQTLTVSNTVSGPGTLIKLGDGTLTLSGTNTFSGGVTFAGGTLSVARDANLGAAASPLTFDGGTLQITGTAFTATTRPITWGQNGGGLDIADPANTFTLAQALAGPGGLTKLGAGTLALAGTNTYTGATTLAEGTLLAQGGQAIGDLSAVTIAAGATLALADSETIGSLAGQGRVALGSARLTAGGDDTSTTFAGTLDGTGGLTKAGAGTLTLTGASTYTGTTTIAAGTLSLTATASLAAPVLTRPDNALVNAGTLAGGLTNAGTAFNSGAITGAVTNIGSLITSGTVAGGLTNTGTVLASAGRIDGAIRNDAGIFTVSGAVASDGTFANAANAGLVVTGAYNLVGALTNAGLVTVARTASLTTAAGVSNSGTLASTGTIAGGLTNAGLAFNDGAITGGVGNTGTLTNSGLIAGGLTNTGTITASAGRIDGAIRNDAGTLIVSGTVFSDAALANAPGATLAVTGAYSLAGPLTNTGTVAITRTASLTAPAGLGNAGSLTNGGTITGAVANTGTLTTSGTIAGSLANAGQAANSGAVTGGVSNSGALATSGTIAGGLTNTGTVTASAGRIDGAIRNDAGTLIVSGTVSSDAALANAPGAALAVTGAYSLAGPLTNTGTVTVAQTASLTALAGLGNAGSLTNGGTITGAVANTGTLSTSGTIAGSLANAGQAANSGAVTGGVSNTGTLITSGTIAGGLTNTGTVTASVGRLDGAIRNEAGTLAVTGAVASDSTFANATGATLAVTGTYSLSGLLTNVGTVAVTDGGRFLAGGIANAGLLTVAQNASVVDDLLNTGRLVNAGHYTADAVNAAGATLVNTGTFTTVSTPFANAGTLISSGTLTGGLANTGLVQASGVLAGAVSNAPGATIALTGPTTGITRLTNDGSLDLGRTDLAVGSLAGSTPEAVLGNGQLTVGGDGTSTLYAGRIVDGATQTSLTKVGSGTLTLSGLSPLSGPVRVLGGELAVTGALPNAALAMGPGSLLTGEARFGSVSLGTGATLAPGIGAGALGRISVAGNLSLAPGALYRVDATADGRADRVDVGGSATVAGATVQAVAGTGQYAPRTRYTILTASGGVQGRFAGVSSTFAFLTPFLGYAPDAVTLTLARNDLDFSAVAQTGNQRAAAGAVQAGAVGSPLYDAVAMLSAPQARAAFAALSGDGHATLASTVFANAGLLREAVLDRLRWDTAPAAQPGDRPETAVSLWGQGLGSVGHVRTDGNAAGLSRSSAGFLLGLDARIDTPLGALRLGAVGGNLESSFASPAQVQTGALTSTFGGIYGSLEAGSPVLRFGALAADDPAQLRRVVAFPGLSDSATARLGGHSVQGFGEAGYRIGLSEAVDLEPFAGGAVVSVTRERFAERGGAATLAGFGQDHTVPSATAGLRMQVQLDRDGPAPAFVHGMIAYRRSFGDLVPTVPLAFRGTGAQFTSRGLPLDRDALVSEVGLGVMLAPGLSAGLSYTGQIGARAQDHAAKGSLVYKF
ncbi:autotransporter-associated beta strand repeat-containing protein [Methylobacterium phyllostachyos]|uniref:Autotransporter-associated beta strand repeat-containing protein n=1 Tax=Methylobacterium phyllostachyos TaxID=582672 RepID=A0A1H0EJY0_9HYPH|nr:amidase family protein [Methylobacterium phyllostachyos]SDN82714.1 autotransporter-associated beta strand repeat-containing protein [Methylobacterium phyllostachyos]